MMAMNTGVYAYTETMHGHLCDNFKQAEYLAILETFERRRYAGLRWRRASVYFVWLLEELL